MFGSKESNPTLEGTLDLQVGKWITSRKTMHIKYKLSNLRCQCQNLSKGFGLAGACPEDFLFTQKAILQACPNFFRQISQSPHGTLGPKMSSLQF